MVANEQEKIPTLMFQHMTAQLLNDKMMAENLNKFPADELEKMAHNYAMMSPTENRKDIGIVRTIDVYEKDLDQYIRELRELYTEDRLNAISSSEDEISEAFTVLIDTLFNEHWKCESLRLMVFENKSYQDSFHSIIYSILQEHYTIKHQAIIQHGPGLNEYAYIIQKKES